MWRIKPSPSTLGRPSESTDVAHGHARTRRIRSTSPIRWPTPDPTWRQPGDRLHRSTLWPAPACGTAHALTRPGLRPAPAWRWQRHFWSFRPTWGTGRGQRGARPRARQARSERARARISIGPVARSETGPPMRDPGLQSVPGPRDPPRNPGYAAGSVTGRVLAAGSLRRADRVRATRLRWRRRTVAWRPGMSREERGQGSDPPCLRAPAGPRGPRRPRGCLPRRPS
jgi:hypothetical protein